MYDRISVCVCKGDEVSINAKTKKVQDRLKG